ncbi:MAG: PIN domain-containing protein [Opitutaceae bacterium]|jgi:predicted nucleic acid-binding protein
MRFLLDCDALIALGHSGHIHHAKVDAFFAAHSGPARFLTTPISELAFIRIGTQAGYFSSIAQAQTALALLYQSSAGRITFLADDLGAAILPAYVTRPRDTTDGHLLALAKRHGAKLVTLDTCIPGAELIR